MIASQVNNQVFSSGAVVGGSPPVPAVVWSPGNNFVQWTDGSGVYSTDYPTFVATVDLLTLSSINLTFSAVTHFEAHHCPLLTSIQANSGIGPLVSLDVSDSAALVILGASFTGLSNLNVTGCTALSSLTCTDNHSLTILDLSTCSALTSLNCNACSLTYLDLSGLSALTSVICYGNFLTGLIVMGCVALVTLDCFSNVIDSLDVSPCPALVTLLCASNHLGPLNIHGCSALATIWVDSNPGIIWTI
jgi:hypothetical protein